MFGLRRVGEGVIPSTAVSRLLMGGGAALLLASFLVDSLPGATPGVGRLQLLLGAVGLAGLLGGRRLEPHAGGARFTIGEQLPIVVTVGQLILLGWLVAHFRLENPAFYEKIVPLAVFGFVLHHLLPLSYRLPFFVALSLSGVWMVFGLGSGASLLLIGLLLISLCHVPLPFKARMSLLLVVGGGLALLRAGLAETPWSAAIWPILGSMFMFRLILYMHHLRHSKEPPNFWRTLAYFFLLPNLVFPLFPVVDFNTFRRQYYDRPAHEIYQRGVWFMTLGCVHLLTYRLVYQHATISPRDVHTFLDLSRYVTSNFLLYLRVSGQFHLIAGMLHLFGFRLPETHRFFFLASSFTDFWRRINVYWKDFVMKVFYYPTFFRVRRLDETSALVISIAVVFALNWLLHSYQWFWILGSVLLSGTDAAFWAILALFLAVNSIYELRRGRKRTLTPGAPTLSAAVWLGIRTAATFTIIAVLWSLWTSPTFVEWFVMLGEVRIRPGEVALVAGGLAVAAGTIAFAHRLGVWAGEAGRVGSKGRSFGRSLAPSLAAITLLVVVGSPWAFRDLGPKAREVARDLRVGELNREDARLLQRGYYEELTGINRFNTRLWEAYAEVPERWPLLLDTEVGRGVDDFHLRELVPLAGIFYKGGWFRTNRWGMRDQDYSLERPDGTYRVALMGPSFVMGSGVGDGESFEALIESRFNADRTRADAPRVEILNFAVADYTPLHYLWLLQGKVERFEPNALFVVAHPQDRQGIIRHLTNVSRKGVHIPFPDLQEILREAGVDSMMPEPVVDRRLAPYGDELLAWAYRQIVALSRERQIRPFCIMMTMPGERRREEDIAAIRGAALAAGFTLIDLTDAYDGLEEGDLQVAEWDHHPNPAGHRAIADRLYPEIKRLLETESDGGSVRLKATQAASGSESF